MNGFEIFQTAKATLYKITLNGSGEKTESSSFEVKIDPVLAKTRIYTKDQEEVTGVETIISPHDLIDLSHEKWELQYKGRRYDVETIEPFYKIGTNNISHYEVKLR